MKHKHQPVDLQRAFKSYKETQQRSLQAVEELEIIPNPTTTKKEARKYFEGRGLSRKIARELTDIVFELRDLKDQAPQQYTNSLSLRPYQGSGSRPGTVMMPLFFTALILSTTLGVGANKVEDDSHDFDPDEFILPSAPLQQTSLSTIPKPKPVALQDQSGAQAADSYFPKLSIKNILIGIGAIIGIQIAGNFSRNVLGKMRKIQREDSDVPFDRALLSAFKETWKDYSAHVMANRNAYSRSNEGIMRGRKGSTLQDINAKIDRELDQHVAIRKLEAENEAKQQTEQKERKKIKEEAEAIKREKLLDEIASYQQKINNIKAIKALHLHELPQQISNLEIFLTELYKSQQKLDEIKYDLGRVEKVCGLMKKIIPDLSQKQDQERLEFFRNLSAAKRLEFCGKLSAAYNDLSIDYKKIFGGVAEAAFDEIFSEENKSLIEQLSSSKETFDETKYQVIASSFNKISGLINKDELGFAANEERERIKKASSYLSDLNAVKSDEELSALVDQIKDQNLKSNQLNRIKIALVKIDEDVAEAIIAGEEASELRSDFENKYKKYKYDEFIEKLGHTLKSLSVASPADYIPENSPFPLPINAAAAASSSSSSTLSDSDDLAQLASQPVLEEDDSLFNAAAESATSSSAAAASSSDDEPLRIPRTIGEVVTEITIVLQKIFTPQENGKNAVIDSVSSQLNSKITAVINQSSLPNSLQESLISHLTNLHKYEYGKEGKSRGHGNIEKLIYSFQNIAEKENAARFVYYAYNGFLLKDSNSVDGHHVGDSHFASLGGRRLKGILAFTDFLEENKLFQLEILGKFLNVTPLIGQQGFESEGFKAHMKSLPKEIQQFDLNQDFVIDHLPPSSSVSSRSSIPALDMRNPSRTRSPRD